MKYLRDISIRWKILTGFVGIVLLIVLIVMISLSFLLESRIKDDINDNFIEAGRIFERFQNVRFRQLRQTAILLADDPTLKAAISTGDTTTVNLKIREELRYLLDFDPIIPDSLIPETFYLDDDVSVLLLISDQNGMPLGQLAGTGLPRYSLIHRDGIASALQGNTPERTYIWQQNDRYYNVITVPVWLGSQLQGTLSFGYPIRELEARQLSYDIGMEVAYYVDNRLLTSSFKNLSELDLDELAREIHTASFEIFRYGNAATRSVNLQGENWLVYVSPMHTGQMNSGAVTGYYTVAKSLSQELIPLREIQLTIFAIAVAAILGAVVLSFYITGRITKPIDMLIEGVKRVEQEDFSKPVPVNSRDEFGTLAGTFNNLVNSLQERLLMLKFVSKATLDAIKQNLSKIEPGGEKRDITVFFTDIRGFTAWSEEHTPEQVIDMLNTLFSMQADIVQSAGGDVDKFVGDELIAFFQGEDKEQRAVDAAIQILQKSREFFSSRKDDLAIGIGINTGEVVMGAMGSANRMDYTVLGNNVNLGARLCTAAEGNQILISNSVYLHLERRIQVTELKTIKAKGINQPIKVYQIDWQTNQPAVDA